MEREGIAAMPLAVVAASFCIDPLAEGRHPEAVA
jgi:hypothetical protein